ncbi:MAG: FAD-dependent oxidoreductase [Ardenticatenia bacterium]|nr:FAD-dependent oxidoreductase [Ardenticatenia bacterium]
MHVAILGAGIAGLSAATFLRRHPQIKVSVIEASPQVGGLARSLQWQGFHCDLAPHRLYADRRDDVRELLDRVPMHQLRRRSRIHIRGKWIQDPVNAVEVMARFFPQPAMGIGWHYLRRKPQPEDSFNSLVLARFGQGLNDFFFKPYSEKLFGIPADQISPEWGRRKIRVGGLRDMVRRRSRLYFKSFYYPREGGYGAIPQALYDELDPGTVRLRTAVTAMRRDAASGRFTCTLRQTDGLEAEETFDAVLSSLPLTWVLDQLGLKLDMAFRPAMLTYLLVDRPQVTANHWFYMADARHSINRVAEFKNFAPPEHQLPQDRTVLCCEVTRLEDFSVERVVDELRQIRVLNPRDVSDAMTHRIGQAYPVYDLAYEDNWARAGAFTAAMPNLFLLGRNAQFEHKDVDEIYADARDIAARIVALAPATPAAE